MSLLRKYLGAAIAFVAAVIGLVWLGRTQAAGADRKRLQRATQEGADALRDTAEALADAKNKAAKNAAIERQHQAEKKALENVAKRARGNNLAKYLAGVRKRGARN